MGPAARGRARPSSVRTITEIQPRFCLRVRPVGLWSANTAARTARHGRSRGRAEVGLRSKCRCTDARRLRCVRDVERRSERRSRRSDRVGPLLPKQRRHRNDTVVGATAPSWPERSRWPKPPLGSGLPDAANPTSAEYRAEAPKRVPRGAYRRPPSRRREMPRHPSEPDGRVNGESLLNPGGRSHWGVCRAPREARQAR